jgi:hypothetical protein
LARKGYTILRKKKKKRFTKKKKNTVQVYPIQAPAAEGPGMRPRPMKAVIGFPMPCQGQVILIVQLAQQASPFLLTERRNVWVGSIASLAWLPGVSACLSFRFVHWVTIST